MNISNRQQDILSIIRSLDISPTLFRNACEKYQALTKYLSDNGLDAEMYPQGSFALGTVVRPNVKDPDAGYDLDFICQVRGKRDTITPSDLRKNIEYLLRNNEVYRQRLKVWEECFTIEYAEVDGMSFSIDIVPAVDELDSTKYSLALQSRFPELMNTAIAIPKHNGERNYTWLTNNPKGLRSWFDNINKPFLDYSRDQYRRFLFEQNRCLFTSVEEIPHEMDRSPLQRTIQMLKYHRDVYYNRLPRGDEIKPISAIITVLAAEISSKFTSQTTTFELLDYVLKELEIYSKLLNMSEVMFNAGYNGYNVISRSEGKWFIANPADPQDNLANKWNESPEIARNFFRWVQAAQKDFIVAVKRYNDQDFRTALENGFGRTRVSRVLGTKYTSQPVPTPIRAEKAAKPYKKL